MNHITLPEMDLADMLDVIHYFYEEDLNFSSGEHAQIAESRRVAVYRHLYNVEYKYAVTGKATAGNATGDFGDADLTPFDPSSAPVKPFIPATEVDADSYNPFGSVLDAPIN